MRRAATLLAVTALAVTTIAVPSSAAVVKDVALKPGNAWPFPKGRTAAHVADAGRFVGLSNARVGMLLDRRDGGLLGVWSAEGWSLIDPDRKRGPLWSIEVMPAGKHLPVAVDARSAKAIVWQPRMVEGKAVLGARFPDVKVDGAVCDVEARFTLGPEDDLIRCRMNARIKGKGASVWSVTFPRIALANPDRAPATNRLLIPHRRGYRLPMDQGRGRWVIRQPYPSASAHFQFFAVYGKHSGRGFYMGVEDEGACRKVFIETVDPKRNVSALSVEHEVENRGAPGTSFVMPYDVTLGPYRGDWWRASRLYRRWWVKTKWARKGLIRDRKDLPDWLKRAAVVLRASTTKPNRTVAKNLKAALALSKALDGRPMIGVWYGVQDDGKPETGLLGGQGHVLPAVPGVKAALAEMKKRNIRFQAYVQSFIYDTTTDPKDTRRATPWMVYDFKGRPVPYGHQKTGALMCRATGWWQDRVARLAEDWVRLGCSGIYLDSFGRGSAECFAPKHGHALGGGNYATEGQRREAQRVLDAARRVFPEAIVSGEAPIEAYRDILSINLYAINTRTNDTPVFRTVWGDYSLGHGRTVRLSPAGDNWVPELAYLFVEGTLFGRFFCSGGSHFFLEKEHADKLAFLLKLIRYNEQSFEYLRFGEYLQPARLTPEPPPTTFQEGCRLKKTTLPSILNSVTRSHADGSVAVVAVNIGKAPFKAGIPIDPGLRREDPRKRRPAAMLSRMDEHGKLTEVRRGARPWTETVTLQPTEVVFFVLR